MATQRRTNKPTRRGSSGGANPKNDGRITDEMHEDAMRILRAEYYQAVRGIAHEIRDRIKDGEITDEDGLQQAVHETVDGSYWVIYTHANFQVLLVSDHHNAYSEDFGEPPVENGDINWAALAYATLRRDVTDQMSAEGIGNVGDDGVLYPYKVDEARRRPLRETPRAGSLYARAHNGSRRQR